MAGDIGDAADVAEFDVLDERAVTDHADAVAAEAGGIDIALNAVSFPHVQATPFAEVTVEEVMHPIDAFLRTNLITAQAIARHMTARRSGTILTLSTAAARFARPGNLGYGTTCAAIETMTQRPGGRARSERCPCRLPATDRDHRRTVARVVHR